MIIVRWKPLTFLLLGLTIGFALIGLRRRAGEPGSPANPRAADHRLATQPDRERR